jgi:hypothetical protein
MTNELKATLFCIAFLTDYALCLGYGRVDLLAVSLVVFVTILAASARLEKAEKRLKLYKDDADRRGRELMSESEPEEIHEQHITMTRGKSA